MNRKLVLYCKHKKKMKMIKSIVTMVTLSAAFNKTDKRILFSVIPSLDFRLNKYNIYLLSLYSLYRIQQNIIVYKIINQN